MLFEPLWTVLRFVQWEDTFNFHARLFRCFLLDFLDAHSELAVLFQGLKQMSAVLGQWLADVGLIHNAGHLYEPVSDQPSSLGRHNDALIRCPPKRKYEATPLPTSVNSPMNQIMLVPPFVLPQPINVTHGLYDEPTPPAVAFDLPGSGRVLGGYDGPPTGIVGFILLWVLTLAIVISRYSSAGSGSLRAVCQIPKVAMESTANSGERAVRPFPRSDLPINKATQRVVACPPEDAGHQVSMPGAWLHERQEQSMLETLEESVFNTISWTLFCSCSHMGMKAWARFPGLTAIFASDTWNRGLNDVVTIGRKSEAACSTVCRGLGLNQLDLNAGVSTPLALNKSEQGAAQGHIPIEPCLSIKNLRGSIPIDSVATKDWDLARTTTLEVVYGDKIRSTFSLVASSNVDHFLCEDDTTFDVGESGSEVGNEDEGLFGASTQRADVFSPLEGKDKYRALGRRQNNILSDTGCPHSLRRARSTGHLGKKYDIFDDDDGVASEDFYWTEQVNARLSSERDPRRGWCRYDWSHVTSWPREGRENQTDNWRTRDSQVTQSATPKETSDAGQCRADSDNIKHRRYSSPPLNVDALHSHHAGSGDAPQGIYVVPQKRGRTMSGRCWSPVSGPRLSDRSSGLGFFPFRKMSLSTPETWRPGCLYVPDPPVDEARQADAWWDGLGFVGSCGSASGVGHRRGFGTMNQDSSEQTSFSQYAQDAPVSW